MPFDVYKTVVDLDNLVKLIVMQSNLYAAQKGRNFLTDDKEIKAFLGVNYIMSINQLPTIQSYWESDPFIGNDGIQNTMTRNRFKQILQNLHFSDNTMADNTDRGYKVRTLIEYFNNAFGNSVSNDSHQSVDEHMVKFKGRSGMKQYVDETN